MDALEQLGEEILELTPGRGRRYGAELKRRVVAVVQRERASGRSWASAARALGVPVQTLTRWADEMPAGLALRPVTLLAEPSVPSRDVVVVSPTGYVVEGLDVAGVAELLRMLS